jgi:hypothetical protein
MWCGGLAPYAHAEFIIPSYSYLFSTRTPAPAVPLNTVCSIMYLAIPVEGLITPRRLNFYFVLECILLVLNVFQFLGLSFPLPC